MATLRFVIILVLVALTACSQVAPTPSQPTPDANVIGTQVTANFFATQTATTPTSTPLPPPDEKATETRIASIIFATQTASVPTATNTSTVTSTPLPTDTPTATNTRLPTDTPSITPKPKPTLGIPPRTTYNHSYHITETYDKFQNTTQVMLTPDAADLIKSRSPLPYVIYTYSGDTPRIPTTIRFGVAILNQTLVYSECHPLILLLNDTRRMELPTSYTNGIIEPWTAEYIWAQMSVQDFLSVVNANKVEGKLCNDTFTLSNEQMEALRDVASRMRP